MPRDGGKQKKTNYGSIDIDQLIARPCCNLAKAKRPGWNRLKPASDNAPSGTLHLDKSFDIQGISLLRHS